MIRVLLIGEFSPQSEVREHLSGHRHVEILGATADPSESRSLLARDDYDTAFFDLSREVENVFDLLPAVRRGARVACLMKHNDPAIPAFEAMDVDVLTNPMQTNQLAEVLERLRRRRDSAAPFASRGPLLPVKVGALTRLIAQDEIRIISACENYTAVSLPAGERLLVRRTMRQWEKLLVPGGQFARVHRGLFVNLARVAHAVRESAESSSLHFDGANPPPLPVKRRHWPALRGKLEAWRAAERSRAPRAEIPEAKSIAVLPFLNLSHDASSEVFCDGLSEELLNVLAKVPTLRVVARTSAFFFKGKNLPVPEIARQLGVEYVVEGSVRRAGARVRVTVQLIQAADGFHLWSDNFERDALDVFAVQDEIAAVIVQALQLKLVQPKPATAPDVPLGPRWLALEGRHFWNLRTADGLKRAEEAFGRALAQAPDLASARAGLADVCVIRAMYRLADGASDASDDLQRARVEADRAAVLDPTSAGPLATLGFVQFHEGRLHEAELTFRRAFALNANYATGYQFYAWTLCALGRIEDALHVYDRAIALDPLSFINIDRYAAMLALAGRFPEALQANERAAALRADVFVGNLSQRAPILFALGRVDEAVAVARAVRRLDAQVFRRNSDSDAIFALWQAGLEAEANEYATEVLARLPEGNYLRGFVLAAVQRWPEALGCLERTPTIMLPQLYWSRLWDRVRTTNQFRDVVARLRRDEEYRRARSGR